MDSNRRDNYKWWLLAFLFVTFFLEQGARQIFGATLPQIKLDFATLGVTDAQLGMISTVFTMVFGVALVGSGLAADFFGRKLVLVIGTLLFSLGIFVSGFAQGLGMLIVGYGVLNAVGQCCIAPPSYSLISQYHDNRTRSTAMAIFQSAVYIGVVLSSVCAGWAADLGGGAWRWSFWVVGGIGIAWVVVMKLFMRDTQQGATEAQPTVKEAFKALLTKPTAILIAIAFGMFMYTSCGIRLWTVAFIHRSFAGVSLASAAFHAVFWFYIGAFAGMSIAARMIDCFGRNRPSIRLEVSALGFILCTLPMVAVAYSTTLVGCCVALGILGVAQGVYEAAHYPAMFDCIEPRYRSAATGITGCLAFIIGSFAPMTMGWMNEHFSMRVSMASLSVFFALGFVILVPAMLWFFKRDYIRQ